MQHRRKLCKIYNSWTSFWEDKFGDADKETRDLLTLNGMRTSSRVAISNAMAAKLPWPISCYDEHPTEITKNHRHHPSRQLVYTTVLEAVYGARHSAVLLLIQTAWSCNVCHCKREQCSRTEQQHFHLSEGYNLKGSGKLRISPFNTSWTSQHD